MQKKKTVVTVIITSLIMFMGVFTLWLDFRHVDIVAVHSTRTRNFSSILVNNFPLTDKAKILWWFRNKEMLKAKYNIPEPDDSGYFNITVWQFANGYLEHEYEDRYCFEDMPPPRNCIDKNFEFSVSGYIQDKIYFTTSDERYLLKPNGDIVTL